MYIPKGIYISLFFGLEVAFAAHPSSLPRTKASPLEGEVAFAKQMTVGGQVGSWNSGGTPSVSLTLDSSP